MNRIASSIKNRLSLRPPQEDSLNILAGLMDSLVLQKNCDLSAELEKVRSAYPVCTDFERGFPSICFALATGVGKTRLMGAFIAYLYLAKGFRNFFVLAPNLTIYNKLIEDFSKQYHPDFVVETADTIYMVETKKEGAMEDSDVQEKTQAALQYCKYASEFTTQNGGKPWKYILIPHNMVQVNMSFDYLARGCEA